MSEGDLSGMDREVVEDRVVAMDAVVASSNEGGVHGRRSGRPGDRHMHRGYLTEGWCLIVFFFSFCWHSLHLLSHTARRLLFTVAMVVWQ